MCLINAERTARGLSALAFDAHLQATTLAEGQASVNQKWWGQSSSHVNPQTEAGMSDDQAIDTRFKASGYCDTSKHTYRDGEITYNASGPTGKYSDDETPPKQTNFTCLNACGSPTAAVDWWMNVSPPHRALILTPDFTNVGVTAIGDTAILNDPYTPKGLYIVDFGKCQ
jgi:uncharacterized protein YkwD